MKPNQPNKIITIQTVDGILYGWYCCGNWYTETLCIASLHVKFESWTDVQVM